MDIPPYIYFLKPKLNTYLQTLLIFCTHPLEVWSPTLTTGYHQARPGYPGIIKGVIMGIRTLPLSVSGLSIDKPWVPGQQHIRINAHFYWCLYAHIIQEDISSINQLEKYLRSTFRG